MQTVTVTHNSQEFTFDVYDRRKLDRKQFMQIVSDNGTRVTRLGVEEWSDSDTANVEKEAARQAGLDNQAAVVVLK